MLFEEVINILKDNQIKEKDLIDIILIGSRVYNTFNKNSDYDYIVITKKTNGLTINKNNKNITLFSKENYEKCLDEQKMICIESFFSPYKYRNVIFNYSVNKELLIKNTRLNTIETLKKAVKTKDNFNLAKKRFFHAIRINFYKDQLINSEKIYNFSEGFAIWNELKNNYDGCLKNLLIKYKDWLK